VADEWASVDLLTLPSAVIPPTPLAWLLVWILLLGTTLVLARSLVRAKRAAHGSDESDIDPALLAIAVVSLAGMLSAVRLLWLGIFPLLILAQASRGWRVRDPDSSASSGWILAVLSLLLVSAFVRVGDWPLVSRAIHPAWYGLSFSTIKYDTAAVWLLRDAEIEGNLFNDYTEGNFLAYWLRPRMGVFVNGSMNVPLEVMESRSAILDRRGAAPDESFASLLDRHDVDVFFGSGMPELATSVRTAPYTVAHLERTPGWLQVFRNMRGALYLRKNDKNVENLQRLTRYYARVGVPFDAERGFDPAAAIREANRWSVAHGLVPMSFSSLEGATRSLDPEQQIAARERLASIFALLGLYERSERLDRRRLRSEPDAIGPSRRLVWTRLHQGRYADARAAAEHLGAIAPADDTLSQILVSAAGIMRDLSDEEKRSVVASLPLLTQAGLRSVTADLAVVETRPPPGSAPAAGAVRPLRQ
jgi:hypothetical protein